MIIGKNASKDIARFAELDPAEVVDIGRQNTLDLFNKASERVPAYKAFLKEHSVNPKKIKTYKDLVNVPWTDKENYFRKYPLNELAWDGQIEKANLVARSSGSSGQPFYWPSNENQVAEVAYFYEVIFRSMFNMPEKSTLVVIAYGMGTWVAGTMTLLSGMEFAKKTGTTFVTPGYNRREVVEIIKNMGPHYEQVVICCYPPLLKEILDTGLTLGLDWSLYSPKFILGAESISEEFRDYIHSVSGEDNPLMGTMNTIGSADAMVLGHETPLSIAVRRLAKVNNGLSDKIYTDSRIPTLAQYYPWQKDYFIQDKELILTANSGIPLIRYNIHDNADIYTYKDMEEFLAASGTSAKELTLPIHNGMDYDWKLPFITIYGKSTNAVKFYGAFIYPENIKAAIELPHNVKNCSGKFIMGVDFDEENNQVLSIVVELAPKIKKDKVNVRTLQQDVTEAILKLNTEYGAVHRDIGDKSEPGIILVDYGHDDFEYTIKHRYTRV